MKKLLLLLLIATTTCSAQISFPGHVSNFSSSTPPTDTSYFHSKRYSLAANAYNMTLSSFTVGQSVTSIPDLKGSLTLPYVGSSTPILSGAPPKFIYPGLLFMQNESNIQYYVSKASVNATFPYELWMVLYKPDYFIFEKFIDGPPYMGELGCSTCGLRFTNFGSGGNDGYSFAASTTVPIWQMFLIRLVFHDPYTSGGGGYSQVDLYINGTLQTTTTMPVSTFRDPNGWAVSLGASTNNEYVGWAEYLLFNGNVSSTDATTITNELNLKYKFGTDMPYPRANSLNYGSSGGIMTVSYTFYDPLGSTEDVSGRVIKWVQDGTGGVSNATYVTSVPSTENGRAEITVKTMDGRYSIIPSTKHFANH